MHNLLLVMALIGADSDGSQLTGQPSWFPLGGDVYHERDRLASQKHVLQFQPVPSWYLGFPKAATKAEFEAWLKEQQGQFETQTPSDTEYQIPSSPPVPRRIEDVRLKDQGATLKFDIEPSSVTGRLMFALTLSASERPIHREIEHRRTNVVPFLFAFFADGKAVVVEEKEVVTDGGSHQLIELVPAKSTTDWKLEVDSKSLQSLIPARSVDVAILATFSERQHQGVSQSTPIGEVWDLKKIPPQILVRSNLVRMRRTADGWSVIKTTN